MGTSTLGSDNSEPPFFANGVPECINTNETSYEPAGRKPGRNNGTRVPSAPCTGFTFSPPTSADRMPAPAGSATLKKGCAWFLIVNLISVIDLPSEVTRVVLTASSAPA